MADGVVLNSGSGGVTATTDDCGASGHAQVVKLAISTDGSATLIPADATNGIQVNVTKTVPGTGATNLGKAEDAAHTSGDVGVMALAVRNDTRGALATTDGDYSPPQLNASGDLRTELAAIAGTAPDTNSGNKSAGTLRVVLATDQPALTNKLLVTPDSVALPANQSVNVSQINGVTPLMGNGASGTGALRVSVANDSTGILAGVTTVTTVSTVTNVATIGTSVTPGTGATNLGKAEDAAHSSGDTGVFVMGVRQDADSSPVSADGDYHAPLFDSSGYLKVNVKAGGGTGGTSIADNAAFTRGTTSETPIGGVVETSAPTLTNGKVGALSLTTGGALRVDVSSGGVPGFAEDAAAASGDTGVVTLAVRQDTIASSTSTDGDYGTLKLNSVGRLYTDSSLSQIAGNAVSAGNGTAGTGCQRVTIASDNTAFAVNATLQASTNTQEVVGDAAHDAAIAGNPVRIAGRALTSDYTAVAAGDTADLITTLLGKLVTIPYANPANTWSYAAASGGITNTTGVTAKAAGGAGVRLYVTHVSVINGHATVDTDVQIRDGAAGTVLWRGFAKAAGGGVSESFDPPLRGTANTLIEIANGTTGSATYFNMQGFSAAE